MRIGQVSCRPVCARRQVRQGPVDAGRAAGNDGDLCAAVGCGFRGREPYAGRAAQDDDPLFTKIHEECLS
jgi:hypothetical protein